MIPRLLKLGSNAPFDVWFSRDINNHTLQHWMIVIKYHKLELVRTTTSPQPDTPPTFSLQYSFSRGWTPEREQRQFGPSRGHRSLAKPYDSWSMCRLGWTRVKDREVERRVLEAREMYPPERKLSWSESQTFLRRFAELVVDEYDVNWGFFYETTDVSRGGVETLPSVEMLKQFMMQMQTQQGGGGGGRSSVPNVEMWNRWQANYLAGQQQNVVMNQQIMQNQQMYGV